MSNSTSTRVLPFDRPDPMEPPPAYAELRESTPVAEVRNADGRLAWLVTSYDAAEAVLSDPRFAVTPPGEGGAEGTLLDDGPGHARLRRLVGKAFTPGGVAALRLRIEEWAREHVAASKLRIHGAVEDVPWIRSHTDAGPTILPVMW